MTFNDDDLERVKRDLAGFRSWATDDQVLALIARLEAAEAVAGRATAWFLEDLVNAWRKAAGKS